MERIWLSSPHMSGTEEEFVKEAFATNWIAPLGPHVNGFEADLAKFTNCGYVSVLSSGTAAIHLALILLGVQAGDFVLCSSFTFSATANPIKYQGANPIFIDSEKETWNICPKLLEEALIDLKEKGILPKALILVHLYGMPAKMDEIMAICDQFNIPIIEDAAEAIGSSYKGKAMGTFGKMGVYSFNGNKIITTSGGGALVSKEKDLIEKATFLATQARDEAVHYEHSHIGYNYRMSNVSAGIGRGQMTVLKQRVEARRAMNQFYREIFKAVPGIEFLNEMEDTYSNYWLSTILIDKEQAGFDREELRLHLLKANIEARPLWKPMHLQPIFEQELAYENGCSESLFSHGLCLPSGSNLTDTEKNRIKNSILELIRVSC